MAISKPALKPTPLYNERTCTSIRTLLRRTDNTTKQHNATWRDDVDYDVRTSRVTTHLLEGEGDERADDDGGVENVPQIATVRARVRDDAEVDDLVEETSG